MELEQIKNSLSKMEAGYLETLLSNPIKRLQAHSDIELTEEEICEALIKAKSLKYIRIQYESNEKIRYDKGNELMNPFSPDQLINYSINFYFDRFNKSFVIDDDNRSLITKLSNYFTDTQAEGIDPNKGVLIMGNVGRGKTELMRFFQKNKKGCFKIITCNDVASDYLVLKDELEDVYSTLIEKPLHDPAVFFQKYIGYCFDDLGTEEDKNAFGNKKNVMADLIMAIYLKKVFNKFHITTNLTKEEIENRYGTRVVSRLREMFNVLVLNGKDRR